MTFKLKKSSKKSLEQSSQMFFNLNAPKFFGEKINLYLTLEKKKNLFLKIETKQMGLLFELNIFLVIILFNGDILKKISFIWF